MVFSFFKKKEAELAAEVEVKPRRPVAKAPAAPAPAPSATPATARPAAQNQQTAPLPQPKDLASLDFSSSNGPSTLGPTTLSGGITIDVSDTSGVISAAMEEAAICYANDQVDEAISVLVHDIEDVAGSHALDTWLMLFDLYQMHGKHHEFDELALKFVVAMERSAPVWQDVSKQEDAKPARAAAGGASVLFPAQALGAAVIPQLDQIEKLAVGGTPVKLDFSRVQDIDSEAADIIVKRWQKFKKAKYKLIPAAGTQIADLLKSRVEVMRRDDADVPLWLLLLEIYQLLGLLEDFENAAVDYAVTFEVSPPSWDQASKSKTVAEVAREEARLKAEAASAPVLDAYSFSSNIVNATEATFQDLLAYAAEQNPVCINFAKVGRVDFVSCGMLMNTLVNITSQSRQVVIIGANELIVALFRIMGVADVSTIIRKK